MPTWFVPPIIIPTGLIVLIAACALYQAYAQASIPVAVVVVEISGPQGGVSG